jgi:hypothetical protein
VIRSGAEHLVALKSPIARLFARVRRGNTGRLRELLRREGIKVELVYRSLDVNEVYGK